MSAAITLTADTARAAVTVAVASLPVPVAGLSAPTAWVERKGPNGPWRMVRGLVEATIGGTGAVTSVKDSEFLVGAVNTYRAGTTQTVVDGFGRSVTGGWGTPDSGAAWSLADAAATVSSGAGRLQHSAANTNYIQLTAGTNYADARFETSVTLSAGSVTGASAQTDVLVRRVDANNFYRVRLDWATTGVLTLSLAAVNAGSATTLYTVALGFTHAGSATNVRMIVECEGTTLRAKVYSLAGAPPASWTYEGTVPALNRIAAGQWGVRSTRLTSNTNVNLQTVWDNVWFDAGVPYFTDTETITMDVDRFWLKSIQRSFLNLSPLVVGYEEPDRTGRGDASLIAGRTLPIAQVEVMTGRTWPLEIKTRSLVDARTLEYLLASGDVLFLQVPSDCPIPGGYYRAVGTGARRESPTSTNRVRTLALEECAAPGPDVVTATATWESVLAAFATWEDVMAVYPTWEDLLTLVGDPSEVIVA